MFYWQACYKIESKSVLHRPFLKQQNTQFSPNDVVFNFVYNLRLIKTINEIEKNWAEFTLDSQNWVKLKLSHSELIDRFQWRHDFFPAYLSVIFSMFCIEQAKLYRESNVWSDRAFYGWTIGKLKCQILAWLTRWHHVGVPLWYTNITAKT